MSKDENNGLWYLLGGAVALYLFILFMDKKKILPPLPNNTLLTPTSGGAFNNPGNIRYSSDVFVGEMESSSASFKSFTDEKYGYRAIMKILRSYYLAGYLTLADMMSRYSPVGDGDNNPSVKAAFISQVTGIDQNIDLGTIVFNEQVMLLAGAIAQSEQAAGFYINTDAINDGYNLL